MGGLSKARSGRSSVHLEFGEVPHPRVGAKTKLWVVTSGKNRLGMISWKAQWRRYWFEPYPHTGFDALCLEWIAEFCQEETRKHVEARLQARGKK